MGKVKDILFLLLILLNACSVSTETYFDEYGISFTCPSGWIIEDAEELEDGYYISVEKGGINDSGLLMILAFYEETDANKYVEEYVKQLKLQSVFENLEVGSITNGAYGGYPGCLVEYSGKALGVDHQGTIIFIDTNGRSICITLQEAIADHTDNKKGFKTIEQSLKIKEV